MDTGEVILLAGVGALAAFFFLRRPAAASTPVASTPQSAQFGGLQQIGNNVAGAAGATVASLTGFGPAAPAFSAAAHGLLSGYTSGFHNAATGVSDIAHGNITGGISHIATGAFQTAAAPITSAVSGVGSVIHTIGGLL